jgi:adenylate cyclase
MLKRLLVTAGDPRLANDPKGASRASARAVWQEVQAGIAFAFLARTIAIAFIAAWLVASVPVPRLYYFLAMAAVFFLLGLVPYLARHHRYSLRIKALFIFLDVALIVAVIALPPPFQSATWPIQTRFRFPDYLYLLVYLSATSLNYSPRMVLWAGACIISLWSMAFGVVYSMPDTMTYEVAKAAGADVLDPAVSLQTYLHPHGMTLRLLLDQVVLTSIITGLLAAAVWRARRHMVRQVDAEAARANLSRYFSPDVAERLARSRGGGGMGAPAERPVAVLFVDIVDFTRLSERMSASDVIGLLREFHDHLATIVFRHSGTLDKFMGDGLMATFGTHQAQPEAARHGLACALEMATETQRWSAARVAQGKLPLRIGIGVHFGPGIVGDVGSGRRLEFTVIGDTVNLASRLERMTREHDAMLATSGALVTAVGEEAARAAGLTPRGACPVRGRSAPVDLWVLPNAPVVADAPAEPSN